MSTNEFYLLKAQIDFLTAQNKEILENQRILAEAISQNFATKTLDIKELAQRYGVHINTLYNNPWRMPNYGRSDFEFGKTRWRLSTVMEWEKKSAKQHEADWANMTVKERKKAQGVA